MISYKIVVLYKSNGVFAMIKKADVIIVSAVLLSVAFFMVFGAKASVKGGEKRASVYIDGEMKYLYSLGSKKEPETVRIKNKYGHNEIVVESGCIYVSDSDCKSKDCIRKGRISEIGDVIICAPHKLMIKIEKTVGDDDVSAVTY